MDFEEFCAAAISLYQLEALEGWEQMAVTTFEYFEQKVNEVITIEELAQFLSKAIMFFITVAPNRAYSIFIKSQKKPFVLEFTYVQTRPSSYEDIWAL
ncbi:CDPK-related kinase 4 [Platanthera guangdongensis]|uniref:CDPK-related kinase 4 n=1 Tax=Platanthera guangdongensis TaxID=2320717 RepID=A0ABR2MIM1_9ASPA